MKRHMITVFIFAAWMGISQENDWVSRGLFFEARIRALLAEAQGKDDYSVIRQNSKLFDQVRYALRPEEHLDKDFPLYKKRYPDRMTVLRLDILQFLYGMMDKNYDVKNPLYRKISGFRNFSSQEEKDEWNRFLDENDRLHKKHIRERTLYDEYEKELRFFQMSLANAEIQKTKDSSALEQLTRTINTHVADEKLREIIFSLHLLKDSFPYPSANPPEKVIYPSVDRQRDFLSKLPPEQRGQFLEKAKKESNYTDEELKALEAPFE